MPAKRVKRAPARIGIIAEAAEAWRIGDWHGVNRALGVMPWQVSPFDVDGPRPPAWAGPHDNCYIYWPRAAEMRKRLIEVAGPPGHWNRHGEPLGPSTDGRPGHHHGNVPPDHEG